jgi:hypothetical protein
MEEARQYRSLPVTTAEQSVLPTLLIYDPWMLLAVTGVLDSAGRW